MSVHTLACIMASPVLLRRCAPEIRAPWSGAAAKECNSPGKAPDRARKGGEGLTFGARWYAGTTVKAFTNALPFWEREVIQSADGDLQIAIIIDVPLTGYLEEYL